MIYWQCDGCNETLQGIIDEDGDFISDKELNGKILFRSVGCYLCGSFDGIVTGEVEED